MIKNTQTPQKPSYISDGSLSVIGQPWLTVQGEGVYSGHRSVFVRLAGCNLKCTGCDTEYTRGARTVTPEQLLAEVLEISQSLITGETDIDTFRVCLVLTGGEPFRQHILPFLKLATKVESLVVQIETNGTLFPYYQCDWEEVYPDVTVVCSPKTPSIHHWFVEYVDALKYIIEADAVDEKDGLPTRVLGDNVRVFRPTKAMIERFMPIYIQPMDESNIVNNDKNVQKCCQLAMKYGYILNLQIHKIAGLP